MLQGTCDTDCCNWNSCETKWYRGERGEEQVCCPLWDGFYRFNPDFPHGSSEDYPQKLIEVIKNSVHQKKFVTAHHFTLLLPFEALIKSTIAKIYTDAFDRDGDQKTFDEGLLLFQTLLKQKGKHVAVLINLAYFKEYSSHEEADELMIEALKENPPLSYVIKFYRWLRDDRKKADYLRRLLKVAQEIKNEKLQMICCELERISELSQSNELLATMERLLRFTAEFRSDVEDSEMGKLINRHLNRLSSTLESKGDTLRKSGRPDEAQKCYEVSIQGFRLFTELRPDNPGNYASVVMVFNKLRELRSNDYDNDKVEKWIMTFASKAIPLMQASQDTDFSYCLKLGTMFKIIGEINKKHDRNSDMKACFERGIDFLNAAIQKCKPPTDSPEKERRQRQQIAINKGICLQGIGHIREAIECFDPILAKYPSWYEGYLHKGKVLQGAGDYAGAELCYKKCVEIDRGGLPAYDALVILYRDVGRYQDAVYHCAKLMNLLAVRKSKKGLDYNFFRLARIWEDAGNDNIAGNIFKYIIEKRQPGHLEAHSRLFNIYKKQSRWNEAASILEKKIALPTDDAGSNIPALSDMANYCAEQNQIDQAINYVARIIDIVGPDNRKAADDFFWRAHLYRRKSDKERAQLDFAKASELYAQTAEEPKTSSEKKDVNERPYNWGQCLYWTGRITESIERFETNLTNHNLSPSYKLKTYAWLIKLYGMTRKWDKLAKIKKRVELDDEIKGTHLKEINTEKLDVLLDTEKMREYVRHIDERLSRGDYWAIIEELKNLIKLHRLFEGQDDVVLLTKIAEADIGVGDNAYALKTLNYVMTLDTRPKNQSLALSRIGRVYMAQGKYEAAAEAFGTSYAIAGDIGMLTKKASALRKLRDYDGAINLYNEITKSGKDNEPWKTKTGLAQTYLSKYNQTQDTSDLQNTITNIQEVLRDRPNDWRAIQLLVAISKKTNKIDLILSFLKNESLPVAGNVLRALATHNNFDNQIICFSLQRLQLAKNHDIGYSDYIKTAADFLMKASVYSYFFAEKKSEYNELLKSIVKVIASSPGPSPLLREYLCGSRGAYTEFIDKAHSKVIMNSLDAKEDTADLSIRIRDRLLPEIRRLLINPYIGSPHVHYQQKDSELAKEWRTKIDGHIAKRAGENRITTQWLINNEEHTPAPLPWYFAEQFFFWLLPNNWDNNFAWDPIWNSDSIASIIIGKQNRNIEIIITASYAVDTLDNFSDAKVKIQQSYKECPVPNNNYGLSYSFDTTEMDAGKLTSRVQISLGAPVMVPYELVRFWSFMSQSFVEGLKGEFKPAEFRKLVCEIFPDNEFRRSFGVDRWLDFIKGFIDHHYYLALSSYLEQKDFHNQLHDCKSKGDLFYRCAPPYPEELVTDFLRQMTALKYKIGAQRKRQLLSGLIGIETILRVDIEDILQNVIEAEQKAEKSIQYVTDFDECSLVPVDEPLIRRAFSSLIRNASIAASKVEDDRVVSVHLKELDDTSIVTIDNPYNDDGEKASTGTGYGLIDARTIIEQVHGGHLELPQDRPKTRCYRVTVTLPLK